MKALIFAAALLTSVAAQATEWAMPNTDGGFIYATAIACPDKPKQFIIYTRISSGETFYGCYFINQTTRYVMASWIGGKVFSYPTSAFVEVK